MSVMQPIETLGVKSPEQIKQEIEGKTTPDKDVERLNDLRLSRDYKFSVSWVDPHGKTWKGDFTNRILNFTQISQVGAIRSRMSGGLPSDSLDAFTASMNEKIAHLTVSLIERPKWASDLGDLLFVDLLDEIYKEVAEHEAIFSGRKPAKTDRSGRGGNPEGPIEKLVESKA